jgi:hypothetical protein
MAFIKKRRPWDSQPQEAVGIASGTSATLLWNAATPLYNAANGRVGTLQGNPTQGFMPVGKALAMDGTGDAVEFSGSKATSGIPSTYTMAAIFNCPSSGSHFVTGTSSATNGGAHLSMVANKVHAFVAGVFDLNTALTLTAGDPYLVAITIVPYTGVNNYIAHAVNLKTGSYTTSGNGSGLSWQTGDGLFHVGGGRNWPTSRYIGSVAWAFHSDSFVADEIWVRETARNPWQLFAPQSIYIPVSAGGGTPTLLPSGISSLEAFGTASISVGPISVLVSGISSSEAFGTHVLSNGSIIIVPSGIASLEAFGTAILDRGTVIVSPNGISTAEAFGTASALVGTLVIYPNGISSAELFGIPAITGGTPSLITSVFYVRGFSSFGNRRNY